MKTSLLKKLFANIIALLTGFICIVHTTYGQTFNLVKDIYPGVTGSTPGNLININGTLFFSAADSSHGYELWKSDGTAAGTVLLKVIDHSISFIGHSINSFTNVNGTLFFRESYAIGIGHGAPPQLTSKLWKSDGTATGTVMIYSPNTKASTLGILGNLNGTLYFSAPDSGSRKLWKSNGTAAGTVSVGAGCRNPSGFLNINGTFYFSATDYTNSTGLWKSDGTAAGTVLVKNIFPGGDSQFKNFTNVNGMLYCSASDYSINGQELWKSDGTAAGTVLVKDIYPGATGSNPYNLTNINGTLYFNATDSTHGAELWKSDGTSAGTVLVKDIYPGVTGTNPGYLTNVNGSLYFTSTDAAHGTELWKSDGTTGGTVLVKDIYPGVAGSNPGYLTNVNGSLYFSATDSAHGTELWKSDGTAGGTLLVQDFEPGTVSSSPGNITVANGITFLTATTTQYGTELYAGATPTTLKAIASTSTAAINCFGGTAPVTVNATGGKAPYTGTGAKTVSAGRGTILVAPITPATGKYISTYYTIGGVSSSKNYVLKFSTFRSAGTATLRASIRQTHTPWAVITAKQAVTIGTSRIDHSFLFTAPPTQDTASFYIEIEQTAGNTWIDNIAFFEADAAGKLIGNNRYAYGQFEKDIKNIIVYSSPVNHTAVWDSTGKISSTYYYTVTDADGNTSVAEVKTSQPAAALKATATAGKITTAGGTTTITIAAIGGTTPYTGTGNFTKGVGTYNYTVTDAKGCTATVSITLTVTAAKTANPITVVAKPLQLTVFPNPATATVILMAAGGTNEKLSVQVCNAAGIIVYQTTGNTNTTYTFGNHFTPGVYAVKVIQGNTVQTLKIIKTK